MTDAGGRTRDHRRESPLTIQSSRFARLIPLRNFERRKISTKTIPFLLRFEIFLSSSVSIEMILGYEVEEVKMDNRLYLTNTLRDPST